PYVEQHPDRAPQQVHPLEELLLLRPVESLLPHHVLAVQRPPFDRDRCPHVLPRLRPLLLRVHQLEVMAGVAFVERRGGKLVAAGGWAPRSRSATSCQRLPPSSRAARRPRSASTSSFR